MISSSPRPDGSNIPIASNTLPSYIYRETRNCIIQFRHHRYSSIPITPSPSSSFIRSVLLLIVSQKLHLEIPQALLQLFHFMLYHAPVDFQMDDGAIYLQLSLYHTTYGSSRLIHSLMYPRPGDNELHIDVI
jgi:hypothetical protein